MDFLPKDPRRKQLMNNILLKRFPIGITPYKGFHMLHVDNDFEIVEKTYTGCRETFVHCIRHKYNGTKGNFDAINTHRLYILATLGASNRGDNKKDWDSLLKQMMKSLKLLNSFERNHKWPLSKIRFVDNKSKNWCIPSALFIGNRKWIEVPYLVSWYTLLMRSGTRGWLTDDIVNETDHDKLITALRKSCKNCMSLDRDAKHIYSSLATIDILMANYKELFSDKPRKYHWDNQRIRRGRNPYNEGIRSLADGVTGNAELRNKCEALKKRKQSEKEYK